MKKLILIGLMLSLSGIAYADVQTKNPHGAGLFVSGAIYDSSSCITNGNVVISSRAADLHSIIIGTTTTGAGISVFNNNFAPVASDSIGYFDAGAPRQYFFDTYFSSGILVNIQPSAAITVIYRRR